MFANLRFFLLEALGFAGWAVLLALCQSLAKAGGEVSDEKRSELLNKAWYVGQSVTTGWLSKNIGIMSFQTLSADISSQAYGDGGLPSLALDVEAYAEGVSLGADQFLGFAWGLALSICKLLSL